MIVSIAHDGVMAGPDVALTRKIADCMDRPAGLPRRGLRAGGFRRGKRDGNSSTVEPDDLLRYHGRKEAVLLS